MTGTYGDAFPRSAKIYVEGPAGVRVPMREIALSGGEAPVRVYDTSGPQGSDVRLGLPRLRQPWIEGRGVERTDGEIAAPLIPESLKRSRYRATGPVTQLFYARRGEITLTFDDGPDPAVTPLVLDLLDRWGARASFFAIGRRAAAHPDVVAEIARRGHRVENHTWSHPGTFCCYPPAAQRRQIRRAQEAIAQAAGQAPGWFRAPAGFRNPLLDRELCAAGLRLAAWTRRAYDTVEREPAHVARRLVRRLAAGDVLLLHDGSAARDRHGRPVVLEALPRILDAIAARGLRSVPLA